MGGAGSTINDLAAPFGSSAGAAGEATYNTLAALETALLAGSAGDTAKLETAGGAFIGRWQHVDDGAHTAYIRAISPVYVKNCTDLTTEIDFSDSAVLEVISGSAPTFSSGLVISGDTELIYHFMGQHYAKMICISQEGGIFDAVATPANNSFAGVGLVDLANKGTNRLMGGCGYYLSGTRWKHALNINGTVSLATASTFDVWAGAMPTTAADYTATLGQIDGTATAAPRHVIFQPHTGGASTTAFAAAAASPVATAYNAVGAYWFSGASTTLQDTVGVISTVPLDIPALGY